MIHYLRLEPTYGPRSYLKQWFFDDILVVTDLDIWKATSENIDIVSLVDQHPCKNVVVDLSLNPNQHSIVPPGLQGRTLLSSMYSSWYKDTGTNIHFFPVWVWKFSLRDNFGFPECAMDAAGRKTKNIMCLNRNYNRHRKLLYERMQPVIDRMCYTYGANRLPGDQYWPNGEPAVDIGLDHEIYDQYAVNLVTESNVDTEIVSEKIAKAFMSRQIPVAVGAHRFNQFMQDLGLDMFADLVPWHQWDDITDSDIRVDKIADFVIGWINSGTMLQDYARVRGRIERNKQWFHSDEFRARLLKNMPDPNPY